jgi:DNA-binding MarR family transcriptional regulator
LTHRPAKKPDCGENGPGPIRTFRARLRVMEQEIVRTLQSQTDCCGVTLAQCHLLLELDSSGCVNLKTLCERLELDKSTLSRTVDSLVGLELLTRREDPENRRQQIICLSGAGAVRVAEIHRLCDTHYEDMLERIPVARRSEVMESIGLLALAMVAQRKGSPPAGCS